MILKLLKLSANSLMDISQTDPFKAMRSKKGRIDSLLMRICGIWVRLPSTQPSSNFDSSSPRMILSRELSIRQKRAASDSVFLRAGKPVL